MKTEQEIRQMVNTCNMYHNCAGCPYNPEDISRFIGEGRWKGGCPNYDKKLVYAMGKGYGDVSEYKTEIRELKADLDHQIDATNDAENLASHLQDDYDKAFERLKVQEREIAKLKAENDSLYKKIAELEQDLIHADENVFYRECDVKLAEDKIKKQAQIDVLNKVRDRLTKDRVANDTVLIVANYEIDELIKEVNENDLFFDKAEAEKKLEGIRNGNKN